MQVIMLHVFWNLDEDVVALQLVFVASKKLLVVRQGAALLAVDFEVSHLLAGFVEVLGVLDADHGGEERLGDVSLDLRLHVGVKDNSRFVLENLCNLVAGNVVLWKVIKVDKRLLVHHLLECFCFFVCFLKFGFFCFFLFNEYVKECFIF